MADNQRIHPVKDPEAAAPQTATSPLVPRGSFRSDKGDPAELYPPFRRTIPYAPSKPPPRKSCCRKCLCWTISLILLQILFIGILAAIIYFVFQPKIPKYSVDAMRITQFNLGNDNSLSATFNVNITARNPNEKIGPPKYHLVEPYLDGADAGCKRITSVVGGATANGKDSFESSSQGSSEAEAWKTETDEMEVLGEMQADGRHFICR
ncbi:NDR1 HIN1 6 [Olea europaea subsp. europaea]|uniref:NDR1 HIN1 6 n=1 Tax=Olea europaea subsp. europaea TaxID=158383 RepID=A0A8S0RMU6_OLEEU|nr:NDR1 HIN1 6 [Olea europaea subsp. europaea]